MKVVVFKVEPKKKWVNSQNIWRVWYMFDNLYLHEDLRANDEMDALMRFKRKSVAERGFDDIVLGGE